jgi:ATP-dependent DNA helicase 2 subunit 2
MLAKRSSSAWVLKATEEMKNYTTALIEISPEGNYYQKVLECFVALRKACIIEQVMFPTVIYFHFSVQ